MRDGAVGPVRAASLRAAPLLVALAAGACSLTDLDGLAAGTGGAGGETSSSAVTASGEPSSTSGSSGGGTSSSSGASSSTTTGAGPTTGSGGEGGGDGGGGAAPCLEGQICQLVDDFEDGSAELWARYGICVGTDTDGVLTLQAEAVAQMGSYCGYYTPGIYDFRGGSIVVAVNEVTTDGFGVQTYVNVNNIDESATVGIVKSNDELTFADMLLVPYDAAQHRFWRISDRDGAMVLSVHSADPAADWVELLVVEDHDVTLETVRIALGIGTFSDNAMPGRAVFDCVNVPLAECPAMGQD